MKLMKLDQTQKTKSWFESVELDKSTFKQYLEANLREMFEDEIVLDAESRIHGKAVEKLLDKEGYAYSMWDSSSKGYHFHLTIKGLQAMDEFTRKGYREMFIDKFKTDKRMKSDRQFIAMEYKPHLKTGRIKTLLKTVEGENKLDIAMLMKVKQLLQKVYNQSPKSLNTSSDYNISELKNKIKISDLWKKWGLVYNEIKKRWDTPFGVSVSKACVHVNDDKGVWYDFNTEQGGDLITAVMLKHDCTFTQALEKLKENDY